MATISPDDSTTTKEFQFAFSLDSGLCPARNKCSMCGSAKKVLYCADCVNSAHFISTSIDSFQGSQQCLFETRRLTKQLEDDCIPLVREKQKADQLKLQISLRREKLVNMKLALEAKRTESAINKQKLNTLRVDNHRLSKKLPGYDTSVKKLENYNAKRREEVLQKHQQMLEKNESLKKLVKTRVQQLIEYIFPISKIKPKSVDLDWGSDMVEQIAEASHMTYISDRWVYADNSSEVQYSIVAPTLPGSGDYSSYNLWAVKNPDNVPSSGTSSLIVENNPAYRISAALTYTAQLVNVIAYYLDIRLPYKMVYKDFSSDMNDQQLARRVARLNANVLHLCFSQNVDLGVLQPTQTLFNIMQMVADDTSDLGRYGPMEVDAHIAYDLENQLGQELQTGKESDSEDGDAFPNEWEAVPHVPNVPEVSAGPINLQSMQTIPQAQASSMSGLYNTATSFFSMWRGFTGENDAGVKNMNAY